LPDPDLAAWCQALATPALEDAVPPGWLTARELAAKLGKAESTMNHQLCRAIRQGKAERQEFRIIHGAVCRPVPHYRLK
jgi:response regulator of citrate/malate metabolism